MKNAFLILLILFGFSRCTEECETCGQGKIMESYVLKYYILYDYSNIFISTPKEDSAGISFETGFYSNELITPLFPEDGDMVAKFREIARNNGDTAYYHPVSTCFPYTCLPDKAGRFDIYCDREYAEYPAETLLNDRITIRFNSAEDFVKSNYTGIPVRQYCMSLTDFNEGNFRLVASSNISFLLSVRPDYPGEYSFVFTYSDSSVKLSNNVFTTFD
jgi:hypothetical protein